MKYMDVKFWLIAVIATAVIFTNLGAIPLLDPDEPVYGQTAKEMIAAGDFISPRIYGEYWYDKPPMYYWLVALCYKLFGVSEFSARLPSAFLGVAGSLAVYVFARRLFTGRAALISSLVLITSIEYLYLTKAAVTDITLSFCLTVSLLSFLTKRYYLFYFFAALATLTKGPVGIFFPLVIVFLYVLITRNFHILRQMKLLSGLLLFAVITLPWYLIMYYIHGQVFIETFLGFHNITRFTSPEHPNGVLWYYFIPVLMVGFFPWTAVLLQASWASITKSRYDHFDSLVFLNIWAAFIFLFFTASQTKLVSYILPMYPALAMLTGWYIDQRWDNYKKNCFSWGTLLFIFSGLLIAGMWYGAQKMPDLIAWLIPVTVLLAGMAIVCLFFARSRQVSGLFWTQAVAMLIFTGILFNIMFPAVAPRFNSKHLAEEFLRNYDGHSPVYITKFLRPGFVYYTAVYGQQIPPKEKTDLSRSIKETNNGYYIIRQKDYDSLPDEIKNTLVLVASVQDGLILREK